MLRTKNLSKRFKGNVVLNNVNLELHFGNIYGFIGANGSGKSKLGAWIEENDMENVHRIGAQRNLNFNEYIPLKSYEQAKNSVLLLYDKGLLIKSCQVVYMVLHWDVPCIYRFNIPMLQIYVGSFD